MARVAKDVTLKLNLLSKRKNGQERQQTKQYSSDKSGNCYFTALETRRSQKSATNEIYVFTYAGAFAALHDTELTLLNV